MMTEIGTVVSVADRHIIVEVLKTSACKSCQARQGCGQAVMSEWGDENTQAQKNHFKIPYTEPIRQGDHVTLAMVSDVISKVALLIYILPLLVGFIGLVSSKFLGFSEGVQLLVFIISLLLSYVAIGQLKFEKQALLEPKIVKVSTPGKASDIIASS